MVFVASLVGDIVPLPLSFVCFISDYRLFLLISSFHFHFLLYAVCIHHMGSTMLPLLLLCVDYKLVMYVCMYVCMYGVDQRIGTVKIESTSTIQPFQSIMRLHVLRDSSQLLWQGLQL